MKASGNLYKMKVQHKTPVEYELPIGEQKIGLNQFIGEKIRLTYEGVINCIHTGEEIKKSYGQGYSYKAFMSLAECDTCIVQPHLCHFKKGTCRDEQWAKEHCFIDHVIYLANTSKPKIGITRHTQVPTRWIDQGASFALPILTVKDRYQSGLIEKEFSSSVSDRTNWRDMLKGSIEDVDLVDLREQLFEDHADLLDSFEVEEWEDDVYEFEYPVEKYPEKVKSLSFDKQRTIEGKLQGIKGQYLLLDCGVVNIRKHNGYKITFEA